MHDSPRPKHLVHAPLKALAGIVFLASTSCLPFESSTDAGVSYSAVSTDWSDDTPCIDEGREGAAKEILNTDTLVVVLAGGANPISDEAWGSFEPPSGWVKNSTRNLEFGGSCFARSPNAPNDCDGDACNTTIDVGDHTWIELSQILSVDCIPSGEACNPGGLSEGELAFIVTKKCHQLTFEGEVVMLDGPNGERAVLHASSDGVPSTNVGLPDGWSLSSQTLDEPLTLIPFGGPGECYYNIIRDAAEQSYHQFEYAGATYP